MQVECRIDLRKKSKTKIKKVKIIKKIKKIKKTRNCKKIDLFSVFFVFFLLTGPKLFHTQITLQYFYFYFAVNLQYAYQLINRIEETIGTQRNLSFVPAV